MLLSLSDVVGQAAKPVSLLALARAFAAPFAKRCCWGAHGAHLLFVLSLCQRLLRILEPNLLSTYH